MYIFNQENYLTLLEKFKAFTTEQYGEKNGFAWDGPITLEKWEHISPRILFLAKETYGYKGCDKCHVIGDTNGWKASKFNRNISKLAYGVFHFYETGRGIERFPHYGAIRNELENAYSKIALVEVKKTSPDGSTKRSKDVVIHKHSVRNAEFLRSQIELLNPDVVVCCGLVTFHSLVEDMKLFPCEDRKQGIKLVDGKLIVNYYHPSASQFKIGNIYKEIIHSIKNVS